MAWSYKEAGVNIDAGNKWIDVIDRIMKSRRSDPAIIGGIGSFAGLYALDERQFLAACCDGVGTKLEVAKAFGKYKGLGQDLVAMNLNDLVTCGARPLFFLDYIACGSLNVKILAEIMEGIADACDSCGCAILGGETAEMPGVYPEDGFDLAGFSVGLGERTRIINGENVHFGDVIIGIPSSGVHSNGFSLVRPVIDGVSLNTPIDSSGITLGEALLEPTRLYVNQALQCLSKFNIKAMAHITGGGLLENIARAIPESVDPVVDFSSWERPSIFNYLSERGIEEREMRRVFNLGIGYVFVCSARESQKVMDSLRELGEGPVIIGEIRNK